MLTILFAACILASGNIFFSVKFGKRFEETLPISIFSVILLLYVFSYVGLMREGVYIIIFFSFCLYIMTIYEIYIKKERKEMIKKIFTPSFFLWMFMFLFLFLLHKNRLLTNWDEFSHWGDVVKSMYNTDDFSTSVNSLSTFKEYPPGLSLFQYFFQAINGEFNESLLYISYQIIPVSLLLSFAKQKSWKNFLNISCTLVIILLVPIFFNTGYLTSIYVDSILAITAGYTFAIICVEKKELFFWIKLGMALCVLVLLKDVGKFFAFEGLLLLLIWCIFEIKKSISMKDKEFIKKCIKQLLPFFILTILVLIVIASWNIRVEMDGVVPNFAGKVDMLEFVKNILNRGDPQNVQIYRNFINAFATRGLISISGISLSFFGIMGIFLILFFVYYRYCENKKIMIKYFTVIFLFSIFYSFGICMMYIFKFSSYEAMILASFERYLSMYVISAFVFITCLILYEEKIRKDKILLIFLLLIGSPVVKYVDGFYDKTNHNLIRQPYTEASNNLTNILKEHKKDIYIISQQSNGFDYWVLKFSIRNNISDLNKNFSWSLGLPYYEGDIWTKNISMEEWREELKENYDLLLLYKSDEKFVDLFGGNFVNESEIHSGGIYSVNKETGKLSLLVD